MPEMPYLIHLLTDAPGEAKGILSRIEQRLAKIHDLIVVMQTEIDLLNTKVRKLENPRSRD